MTAKKPTKEAKQKPATKPAAKANTPAKKKVADRAARFVDEPGMDNLVPKK